MTVNNFLQTVMMERREDARIASRKVSLEMLQRQLGVGTVHRSLKDQLQWHWETDRKACIIAEVKKASPSAGLLRPEYHPAAMAREVEQAGAVGVSVLTEPRYFLGCDDDLRAVHRAVNLPALRKDFISDPYQMYESAVLGADIILLIAAALDVQALRDLYTIATTIGLEVIVEIHTRDELERVRPLTEAILGVNSRDLRTMKTDLMVSRILAPLIPPERCCIAESGIKTRAEIEELQALGYKGFLVGESLMRSDNIGAQLQTLMGHPL